MKTVKPVTIACLGDSITFGYGVDSDQRWTSLLGTALGAGFQVENYGINSRTLSRGGDFPYVDEDLFRAAVESQADVALIALGTNDSKAHNWKGGGALEDGLEVIVGALRASNPATEIFCLLPVPALTSAPDIDDTLIREHINPALRAAAEANACGVIDLYAALDPRRDTLEDLVHPDAAGHAIMAGAIFGDPALRAKVESLGAVAQA